MSKMVKVQVELPEPPEGWAYTGEFRQSLPGESTWQGATFFMESHFERSVGFILRRIAPATMSVTLRREDAVQLKNRLNESNLHDGGETWYGRVKAALAAALSEEEKNDA